jgi:hypothetical protein
MIAHRICEPIEYVSNFISVAPFLLTLHPSFSQNIGLGKKEAGRQEACSWGKKRPAT